MTVKGYLAGPITDRTEQEMTEWRDRLKRLFLDVEWDDPTKYGHDGTDTEKVSADIRNVLESDVIVFMFDGCSIGTAMELRIAFELHKRYVIWWKNVDPPHLWIEWHIRENKLVRNWTDLVVATHEMIENAENDSRV